MINYNKCPANVREEVSVALGMLTLQPPETQEQLRKALSELEALQRKHLDMFQGDAKTAYGMLAVTGMLIVTAEVFEEL